MICVYYENYNGGVNNLCVAVDWETGERATSLKSTEQAIRNLKRKLRTARKS